MKKVIISSILSTLILVGCNNNTEELENKKSGFLTNKSDLFYDFGDININGGLISHTFQFHNDSDEVLKISNLYTSCGCTKAKIIESDKSESELFSMNKNKNLDIEIKANSEFKVEVIYDPMAHGPKATGDVNRSVFLISSSNENSRTAVNDEESNNSFTQMNIKGLVLSEFEYYEAYSEL